MRTITLYIFLLLFVSCKEKQQAVNTQEKKDQSKDSVSGQNDGNKILYIERAHFNLKNYSIAVKSIFNIPAVLKFDSSFYSEGLFLFFHNNNGNRSDSINLEIDNYDPPDLALEDFSDSLHFKTLVFCINWRGDSDQPGSEFIEYNGDSLKHLFIIYNLISLERRDKWTLSGFVAGRDEVVSAGQTDYPVTISLKDYDVYVTNPDKQSIGYSTVALANMKAYRDPKLTERSAYIIKKGKHLVIDSIYRALKLVRLIVSDSIILYGRPAKISDNVEHDNAG